MTPIDLEKKPAEQYPLGKRLPVVLGVFLLSSMISLLTRYRLDFEAWSVAVGHLDTTIFGLLVLGVPFGLILDAILRAWKFHPLSHFFVLGILGTIIALGSATGEPDFRALFGISPPKSITTLSSRYFSTVAGGGEDYLRLQFTCRQADFDQLMNQAGFHEEDIDLTHSSDPISPTNSYELGYPFRYAPPYMPHVRLFKKGDERQVLWDPDRLVANAMLSRG